MKITDELIRKYSPAVYRVAYNYFGNKEDAEDALQNVMVTILSKAGEFENEEHIRNWIIRCTVNECHNIFRNPFRKRSCCFEDLDRQGVTDNSKSYKRNGELTVCEWDSEDTRTERLKEELAKLPERYRMVLYLYYYEEYSVKEIAGFLRRGESTVQTWLFRARKKLKGLLE